MRHLNLASDLFAAQDSCAYRTQRQRCWSQVAREWALWRVSTVLYNVSQWRSNAKNKTLLWSSCCFRTRSRMFFQIDVNSIAANKTDCLDAAATKFSRRIPPRTPRTYEISKRREFRVSDGLRFLFGFPSRRRRCSPRPIHDCLPFPVRPPNRIRARSTCVIFFLSYRSRVTVCIDITWYL